MKVAALFASALLVSSLSGCSTKKKLDRVLDNADKALANANKRIDELSALAEHLEADLSDAGKQTVAEVSNRLSRIQDGAGKVPSSGGQAKVTDETVDLDDDGQPDSVSAIEYDDRMLWLADASTFHNFACNTQLYFVSDKPPENLLSFGLYTETCGAMACPPEELGEDEPDFDTCSCVDANDEPTSCDNFLSTLAGDSDDPDPSGEEVLCDNGEEFIPVEYVCDGEPDCSDASDEVYCS